MDRPERIYAALNCSREQPYRQQLAVPKSLFSADSAFLRECISVIKAFRERVLFYHGQTKISQTHRQFYFRCPVIETLESD